MDERFVEYYGRVRDEVLPLVPRAGGTLLDFGGGIGATAAKVKELGLVQMAGVVDLEARDTDPVRLDFSVAGDVTDRNLMERVAAEHGPFSVILCLDILEHLIDPWAVVRILHRCLQPDGVIVASVPNVRNYRALFPLLFRNRWTLDDAGILDRTHLRFFVRQTAIDLMTSSGLTLELCKSNPTGGRKVKYVRRATLGVFNSFTDSQYLIRVRREGDPT